MSGGEAAAGRRTRIKLCGVTSAEEVDLAVSAGVDAIGLVFTAGAPRCVLPHTAMQLARRIPPFLSVVGVFSNPSDPDLMVWPGRWVQLVGQEDEPQIQRVARLRAIIKGFPADAAQLRRWDRCAAVSAMLVQVPADGDHAALIDEIAKVTQSLHTPVILGGALAPAQLGAWIKAVRPHGIDITLGSAAGDAAAVTALVHAVRTADA